MLVEVSLALETDKTSDLRAACEVCIHDSRHIRTSYLPTQDRTHSTPPETARLVVVLSRFNFKDLPVRTLYHGDGPVATLSETRRGRGR